MKLCKVSHLSNEFYFVAVYFNYRVVSWGTISRPFDQWYQWNKTKQNHVIQNNQYKQQQQQETMNDRERDRETMETRENLNLQERTLKK